MASLRHIFKLALRQLEGFVKSLLFLLKIDLRVPDFSRLSRRMAGALSDLSYPSVAKSMTKSFNSREICNFKFFKAK